MNWWLADEFTTSRFRLQDLPDGDRSLDINIDGGPTLGRAFSIYHGQTSVGRLEISPHHKYTSAHPEVRASLEIDWARFFGFAELTGFFHDVASHVTTGDAQNTDAHRSIQSALVNTLWDNYRVSQYDDPDNEQWGVLTVSFGGTALFYIDRRDAPARPGRQR